MSNNKKQITIDKDTFEEMTAALNDATGFILEEYSEDIELEELYQQVSNALQKASQYKDE